MVEVLTENPVKQRTESIPFGCLFIGARVVNHDSKFQATARKTGALIPLSFADTSSLDLISCYLSRRIIRTRCPVLYVVRRNLHFGIDPFWEIMNKVTLSKTCTSMYEYEYVRYVLIPLRSYLVRTYVRTVVRTAVSNVVILYSQLHFVPGSIFRTYSPSAIGAEGGVALSPGIVLLRTYDKYDFNIILDILVLQYGTRMIRTRIR